MSFYPSTLEDFLDKQFSILSEYTSDTNFPKYNLISLNDHDDRIELALAGYKKEDLVVSLHEEILQIQCNRHGILGSDTVDNSPKDKSGYRVRVSQIAKRNFTTTFRILKNSKITKVKFEDGILTIDISRPKPEIKERQTFTID